MRIDLHAHSSASDGTQTPAELVRAARAAGLDVLALTDHDSTTGWDEAAAEARDVGPRLVRGIEVSTRFSGGGVHLLAYLPDPDDGPLAAELGRIREGRQDRVPAMLARLRDLGIDATEDGLREVAGPTSATGRPHVADLLVRLGAVDDRDEAFARYLGPGGPAFVDRYAADLVATLALVRAAAGVTVLAHPWGRGNEQRLTADEIAALADAGLDGLEADHQDHTPEQRTRLHAIGAELGLVVTGSSDHHGTGKTRHTLGCHTTAPEQLDRILALAAERGSPTTLVGR